jgi:hypothetical protein
MVEFLLYSVKPIRVMVQAVGDLFEEVGQGGVRLSDEEGREDYGPQDQG